METRAQTPSIRAPRAIRNDDRFLQRHAGLIIALGFHFAAATILGHVTVPTPERAEHRESEAIHVRLAPAPPAPPDVPEPEPQAEPPPPIPEPIRDLAATSAADASAEAENFETTSEPMPEPIDLAQIDSLIEPDDQDDRVEPAEIATALTFEPAALTSAEPMEDATEDNLDESDPDRERELRKLDALLAEQREAIENQNRRVAELGSAQIEERLRIASAMLEARKWMSSTDGLREGVIRELDTSGVAPDIVDHVLSRYGIQILVKYLDGTESTNGFLNRAKTMGGTYYNKSGTGHFQVFSFSQVAVAKMVRLEREAIVRRGLDPTRTRVQEVRYGIISTGGGFDLGVTHFRSVQIAPGSLRQ